MTQAKGSRKGAVSTNRERSRSKSEAAPIGMAAKAETITPADAAAAAVAPAIGEIEAVAETATQELERGAQSAPSIGKAEPAIEPVMETEPAIENAGAKTQGAEDMFKHQNDTTEAGNHAADQFRGMFGDVSGQTKAAMEKSAKFFEEVADLTRGNIEAMVASSKVAAKAAETLGQEAADYSRRHFEGASTALKTFTEVKSPTDFFKLQSDYARSAFDTMVAESARVSETVVKLAGEVAEPITTRYAVAAERIKTIAA